MSNILEVRHLFKKYGDFTAVKGISFDIKEGEIFSLLGPNGAGKTTTISMLSTLYVPTSGDATICGHSVTREPMAVKRCIGVVPQELALYDDLTAQENLSFWGKMYGLSGKELSTRINEVLDQIGLKQCDRAPLEVPLRTLRRTVMSEPSRVHRQRLPAICVDAHHVEPCRPLRPCAFACGLARTDIAVALQQVRRGLMVIAAQLHRPFHPGFAARGEEGR